MGRNWPCQDSHGRRDYLQMVAKQVGVFNISPVMESSSATKKCRVGTRLEINLFGCPKNSSRQGKWNWSYSVLHSSQQVKKSVTTGLALPCWDYDVEAQSIYFWTSHFGSLNREPYDWLLSGPMISFGRGYCPRKGIPFPIKHPPRN